MAIFIRGIYYGLKVDGLDNIDRITADSNLGAIHTKMHFAALFPQACASVAFVLSILCVLAGYRPGFMEDYHIITVLLQFQFISPC